MFHVGDIMVPRSNIFSLRHARILHFVSFLYPYLRCKLSSTVLNSIPFISNRNELDVYQNSRELGQTEMRVVKKLTDILGLG